MNITIIITFLLSVPLSLTNFLSSVFFQLALSTTPGFSSYEKSAFDILVV